MSGCVALVRLSALGDVVHTWPLAVALKEQGLARRLVWVVEEPLLPLVEGHPSVDRAIPVRTRDWRRTPLSPRTRHGIRVAVRALREERPETCLDPQGVAKSALITRLSRAPRRLGVARPHRRELPAGLAYTGTIPIPEHARHVVAWNLAFARALGGTVPEAPAAPDGRWLLGTEPAPRDARLAVLLPGAGQPSKVLGEETLAQVARTLAGHGLRVLVAWGPGERERAEAVARMGDAEPAPPTTIPELARLLGSAALVVGGDTGPVHLAASLGTPTVGVHLVTDPVRNRPLGPSVAVVSGAAPGGGRRASARTAPLRRPGWREIVEAARLLLENRPERIDTADATMTAEAPRRTDG